MLNKTLQERLDYSAKLIYKYNDRIPVIIEKTENINLENYKYLIPKNLSVNEFMCIIRTKINITDKQAIFTFVKSVNGYTLVPMNETINNIYDIHKSEDNFLYIKFGIENTFG